MQASRSPTLSLIDDLLATRAVASDLSPSAPVVVLPSPSVAVSSFSTRPVGFSGGFGHIEGVWLSQDSDSLTHPPVFSKKKNHG